MRCVRGRCEVCEGEGVKYVRGGRCEMCEGRKM